MKQEIQKKLDYHEKQLKSTINRFIKSNKRQDRDSVIIVSTKIAVYKELLEIHTTS